IADGGVNRPAGYARSDWVGIPSRVEYSGASRPNGIVTLPERTPPVAKRVNFTEHATTTNGVADRSRSCTKDATCSHARSSSGAFFLTARCPRAAPKVDW